MTNTNERNSAGAAPAALPTPAPTMVDERAAYIAWLGRSFPHVYDEKDAEIYWDKEHVSALAWKARATRPTLQSLGGDAGVDAVVDHYDALLTTIGDYAHDRSTGPAVFDDLWEVRRLAYEGIGSGHSALSLTSTEKSDGWVSFADRLPPDLPATDDPSVMVSPRVFVTNNIDAKNRVGRMSHVWYVHPIKDDATGEWVAFDEGDRKIHSLTHWFDPFASLPAAPKAAEKSGRSE